MGASSDIGASTNKYEKICRCSQFLKGEIKRETDPDAHLADFDSDEPWDLVVNDTSYAVKTDEFDKDGKVEELDFE